jgi:glycosyltransferase A (GT-A) superfamily protein (DUF2064 family)
MAEKTSKAASKKVTPKGVHCPFCDEEIVKAAFPFCQSCGVVLVVCEECGQAVASTKRVCPTCGARLKKSKAK